MFTDDQGKSKQTKKPGAGDYEPTDSRYSLASRRILKSEDELAEDEAIRRREAASRGNSQGRSAIETDMAWLEEGKCERTLSWLILFLFLTGLHEN